MDSYSTQPPATPTPLNTPGPDGVPPPRLPRVPGYEILRELGRGGMGVVYLARQAGLDRLVALKVVLFADHAGGEMRRRFDNEARAVARLAHPNVVQIHAVGEHDGLPYFALEYCPGGTLTDRLKAGPLAFREAAELVRTVALAVQAAHDQGIIHRDLKPANVLFAADGSPRIADFGLAKATDGSAHTQAGAILGTPAYMAPEQARGDGQEVGPRADVYALGAILYECLVCRPPFLAKSGVDTLLCVVMDPVKRPRLFRKDVPLDLEDVCLACLEKLPGRRPASAAEVADRLQAFLDGRPQPGRSRVLHGLKRRGLLAALLLGVLVGGGLLARAYFAEADPPVASRRVEDPDPDLRDVENQDDRPILYGVVAGIDDYSGLRGAKVGPYNYCVSDARAVRKAFEAQQGRRYNQVRLTTFVNGEASRANLLEALRGLAATVRGHDQVVFYFSGHGVSENGEGIINCADSDANDLSRTGLTATDVFAAMAKLPCPSVLLLDYCHAGAFADGKYQAAFRDLPGCTVLAACLADQFSYEAKPEADAGKHGLFTQACLEALLPDLRLADTNGDRQLDTNELFAYTQRRVAQQLANLKMKPDDQTPLLAGNPKSPVTLADFSATKP